MNNEMKEYTFLWLIENYSYCWHKNGEVFCSPEFTIDGVGGTLWYIELSPRGKEYDDKGYVSVYLVRRKTLVGPEKFPLRIELSFLAADGSALRSGNDEHEFNQGEGYGFPKFLKADDVLLHRKEEYLPQDTLSVQCKMWKEYGKNQPVTHIYARTRIGIEHISFLHVVESFSSLEPNEKKTVQIKSPSEKGLALSSNLYFTDGSCCEGKIIVEITPSPTNQILRKYRIFLLDESGKVIQCGQADNRYDATKQNIQKLPVSLTRQVILTEKSRYLPDDKLTLLCECTFTTGKEFEKIEKTLHELPLVAFNQINNNNQNKDVYVSAEDLSHCTSVLDDLKEIYNNQFLADVELKTKTKTFLAHKIVLCARSSVLKAMLTNDMKEKNTNCIEVDDMENDTIQQLLLFMYSDHLENLQWESAIKLYYAGDKYAIGKLKLMCSSFLVKNLSTSTASELLLLADTHNDSHLKKTVEDFIFKHEEEVFGSDEWGNLLETNPLLVSKTMRLKYKK